MFDNLSCWRLLQCQEQTGGTYPSSLKSKNSGWKFEETSCFRVKIRPSSATCSLISTAPLQASSEDGALQPGGFSLQNLILSSIKHTRSAVHHLGRCAAAQDTVRTALFVFRAVRTSFQCVHVNVADACSPLFDGRSANAIIMLTITHFASVVIWFAAL